MKTLYTLIILIFSCCTYPDGDCDGYTSNPKDVYNPQNAELVLKVNFAIEEGQFLDIQSVIKDVNTQYLNKHKISIQITTTEYVEIEEEITDLNKNLLFKKGDYNDHLTIYVVDPEKLTLGAGTSVGKLNYIIIANSGAKPMAIAHEIGHNIGKLKHTYSCGNIMQPINNSYDNLDYSFDQVLSMKENIKWFNNLRNN